MAHIFISYSTRNTDFARYVRGLLQDAGFDVWMDEARLSTSQEWASTLEASITACGAFLIIMSPEAKTSEWVQRELLLADRLRKPIFPVLYSGDIWWNLANIQAENMTAGLQATLSPRLIDMLRTTVGAAAPAKPPVPTTPPAPQTDSRRLEAAMPAETKAGVETEVWAKVSLPASDGLRAELPAVVPSGDVIQKDDTRATTFPIRFPFDPQTGKRLPAQAELRLTSSDFVIAPDHAEVEIPPDIDSRTVIVTLAPKQGGKTSGRARVFIDLIHETKTIAQISVSTQLVAQVTAAIPAWTLATVAASAPGSPAFDDALRGVPAPSPAQPTIVEPPADDDEITGSMGAIREVPPPPTIVEPPHSDDETTNNFTPITDYQPQPAFGTMGEFGASRRSTRSVRVIALVAVLILVAMIGIVVLTISSTNQANFNATATAQAVLDLYLGDWIPTDAAANTPIASIAIKSLGANQVDITYTSACPPQGDSCGTTYTTYTIPSVPVSAGGLNAMSQNTVLLINPAPGGQIAVTTTVGGKSVAQMFQRQ